MSNSYRTYPREGTRQDRVLLKLETNAGNWVTPSKVRVSRRDLKDDVSRLRRRGFRIETADRSDGVLAYRLIG